MSLVEASSSSPIPSLDDSQLPDLHASPDIGSNTGTSKGISGYDLFFVLYKRLSSATAGDQSSRLSGGYTAQSTVSAAASRRHVHVSLDSFARKQSTQDRFDRKVALSAPPFCEHGLFSHTAQRRPSPFWVTTA